MGCMAPALAMLAAAATAFSAGAQNYERGLHLPLNLGPLHDSSIWRR